MCVQWCLTLYIPIDCNPPGYSVHGIFQARILEWIAISSFRRPSWPRNRTHVSCIGRQTLYHWATWEAPQPLEVWEISVCWLQSVAFCYGKQSWWRQTGRAFYISFWPCKWGRKPPVLACCLWGTFEFLSGNWSPCEPTFLDLCATFSSSWHIGACVLRSTTFGYLSPLFFARVMQNAAHRPVSHLIKTSFPLPCSQISVLNHRKAACSNIHSSCLESSVGLSSFSPCLHIL